MAQMSCRASARERGHPSRFAVLVATSVLAGLPLVAAGPAAGAPPRIEFSRDGLQLLSCDSKPSDGGVKVPVESIVTFVNNLDEDATLRIDGQDAARVREDGSTEVLFHRGTVQVQMVPDCGLSLRSDFQAVSVDVVAPSGTPSEPSSSGSAKAGSPSTGSSGGQDSRGTGSPRARNESAVPDGSMPGSPSDTPAAPAGGGARPSGGLRGSGDESGLAAEPLSSEAGLGENEPNGLLIITAVLCIAGVSAGAIRAIVAQRASRTSVA
jgi:hypothetical protein